MPTLSKQLKKFAQKHKIKGKGPLCVMLVFTRKAKEKGLPLNPDDHLTGKKGQVSGLGKGAVQTILKDYGISKVLAEEGGRTSRGSIDNMSNYVEFLNALHNEGIDDLNAIEAWWVDQLRKHFAAKPFALRLDPSISLQSVIRDLLVQAYKRQKGGGGTMYLGAVLQHLVGAKLEILHPGGFEHHGFAVADEATGRAADYVIAQVAFHVTTSPSEAVIRRCNRNLQAALRPIIVTTQEMAAAAKGLIKNAGIEDREEILKLSSFYLQTSLSTVRSP